MSDCPGQDADGVLYVGPDLRVDGVHELGVLVKKGLVEILESNVCEQRYKETKWCLILTCRFSAQHATSPAQTGHSPPPPPPS